ncbi:hypothetical protein LLNZ_08650 [Lactococcus cremoris subsp. cremoris NZ9000]|nr:hypothetical protein LLNZ_08650 [Lactococcus cremoris subsp. cremoris NZ9000]
MELQKLGEENVIEWNSGGGNYNDYNNHWYSSLHYVLPQEKIGWTANT